MLELGITFYCMDNPEHQMFRGNADGARCPECSGLVNMKYIPIDEWYSLPSYQELRKRHKQPNEIEIIMTNVNNPPKIKLNGKEIKGIVELDYNYVTKNERKPGYHNFTVKYHDKETNTVRTVSANKIWEG